MEATNILEVKNRKEWRQWLEQNHAQQSECWVAVKRGSGKETPFPYLDAVEEALCFGWIDSTVKRTEGGLSVQRFTPRRKGSRWSELNKERCRRLERLGWMTDAGRSVLPDMRADSFVLPPEVEAALKATGGAWENFCSFPPLYRRVRVDTIWIKRNQQELYRKRLSKFVEACRQGIMYGAWNDEGRLL